MHLRFGDVARGGLRWSDREEDYRTEVLGLVKAQMVKNTVIVPVGALPVSAVRLAQAQRLATAFPETAPILDAWVSSGHPLRRRQMRALDEYVWARRAQLAAQELLAVPSPADDRAD